jgi:hypothetical protein
VQLVESGVEDFPIAHFTQVVEVETPYEPAGHDVAQRSDPEKDCFPTAQLEQLIDSVEPVVAENFPAGHDEQVTEPVVDAYVPSRQAVQVLAPAAEYVPALQVKQSEEIVAPVKRAYLPAKNKVMSSFNVVGCYSTHNWRGNEEKKHTSPQRSSYK